MKKIYYYDYPTGKIGIAETNGAISHILLRETNLSDYETAETPLIKKAKLQLDEYYAKKRTKFDLPLSLHGTEFQKSVWKALQTVKYGETASYKDIAVKIGNPKAVRAVGMANNKNPVSIVVPCHRIIGSNGSLVGYGGGLPMKEYLLDLEKKI